MNILVAIVGILALGLTILVSVRGVNAGREPDRRRKVQRRGNVTEIFKQDSSHTDAIWASTSRARLRDRRGPDDYLLDESALTQDLFPWSTILPAPFRLVAMNLFCDAFVADASGAVHILEPAAGTVNRIADSVGEFAATLAQDREGRLLMALVDDCRANGKVLGPDTCYGFTTLPMFGGKYIEANIWVCSRSEWLGFLGDVFAQTLELPDGTTIKLRVTQ